MAGNLTAMIASIFSGSAVSTDPYFNLTTLLLSTTATNGQQNNTFQDSSTNNFTITRNPATGPNAPTQGTFSPFSQTGWSNYFDGTDDRLSVPDDAKYYVGSSDFTIECWAYNTAWDVDDNLLFEKGRFTVGKEMRAYMDATSVVCALNVSGSATGTYTTITATTTNSLNTWYHLAFVRSGNTLYIFRDGTLLTSGSVTGTVFNSTEVMSIGGAADGNNNIMMNGYISNFRIITGQAVATSTFTPPTSPLTTSSTGWTVSGSSVALTGTVGLLTCQSNRFIDTSASPLTITIGAGTPQVVPFSPFLPTNAWSASTVGGSGYFDGTGDYLTNTSQSLLLGTSDWCIECWGYWTSFDFGTYGSPLISFGGTAGQLMIRANKTAGFSTSANYYSTNGGNFIPPAGYSSGVSAGTLYLNSWNHIALTRSGSTFRFFINGALVNTQTDATSFASAYTNVTIGADTNPNNGRLAGYTTGVRVVTGNAVYTAAFTPPTAPPTAISGTYLLLNFTNSGIYDATAKNVLETVGNAQASTAITPKWGTTSMLFNSDTSWLQQPASVLYGFGTGNFTVECWFYLTASPTTEKGIFHINTTINSTTAGYAVSTTTTGMNFYANGTFYASTTTAPVGQWNHLAYVKNSGTVNVYLNGTLIQNGSKADSQNLTNPLCYVGLIYMTTNGNLRYLGYMQDFRVTRFARYTANFTPPTAAFPVQ